LRLKVCRFSAIRAFFSADRLINQEVTRLLRHTQTHREAFYVTVLACGLQVKMACVNKSLLVPAVYFSFANKQTNKQTNKHTYKRPDSVLRTTNSASVIKTPNNEGEVACSLCPRNAISLHFSSKASLFSITQFLLTNAPVALEGKIKSDAVIALQGRWQPSERVAVMPVQSGCARAVRLKGHDICAAATRSELFQNNRTPKCIFDALIHRQKNTFT